MSDKLLSVKGLRAIFNTEDGVVKALSGVDFEVERGETFSLVGETGCGKSVTTLAILRILPMSARILEGKILLWDEGLGKVLKRENPIDLLSLSNREMLKVRGARIALITQDPQSSLDPLFTIENQIAEVLKVHRNMSPKEVRREVFSLLEQVELTPPDRIAKKYPHELSGGQRQRVVIAMALAARPALIIADEPTTALDVTIQEKVLNLMKELKEKFHTPSYL
jgi:ABC-type dipeptide/oligopeptide/nickel transport system, ATPase component